MSASRARATAVRGLPATGRHVRAYDALNSVVAADLVTGVTEDGQG